MIKSLFARKSRKKQEKNTPVVLARYDAASRNGENTKHWAAADYLSADAAASEDVRRTLRVRSRYEVANNTYAQGMLKTLADDTIGTGPRLQMLTDNDKFNSQIEKDFASWAERIDLAGKLRTIRKARCQDGEVFILLAENPRFNAADVQLDIQLIEADRVTDGSFSTAENCIDGIIFDNFGNVKSYRILKCHPGSNKFAEKFMEYQDVPAENVIHYFQIERPGQHRGIPEITSALPLFAQLRRFTLAVLSAAEAAADFAGILYTDAPAGGESDEVDPMDSIELHRNMLVTMPAGWKMGQMDPKQPCSSYAEFHSKLLNEIARCLSMPYNIAAGNSSGYNYASGRLDHQTYFKSLRVERANIDIKILNPIFERWLREYSLVKGVKIKTSEHSWFWDGFEHVDPGKEANAIDIKLANGTTTYAIEYAKQGLDWETAFNQLAKEKKKMAELGLTPADVKASRNINNHLEDEDE